MATFTNFATLSYNGGTATSNTVTGELLETLTAAKTAVEGSYAAGDDVTYVVTLTNSGTAAFTNLTVTDNLGAYFFEEADVYPLNYVDGTLLYYVNGVLQPAPTVTAGPPMTITGITVPAGGNAALVYNAAVTGFAPLAADRTITNTVTISGGGLTAPVTAEAVITAETAADLSISKSLSPAVVTENGQLTYTFVIENNGSAPATAADNLILTDVFDPILSDIAVTFNGTAWAEGTNYTYDETTGTFATLAGQITVPAASFTQNTDGTWTVVPGTAVLTITGTV